MTVTSDELVRAYDAWRCTIAWHRAVDGLMIEVDDPSKWKSLEPRIRAAFLAGYQSALERGDDR